MPQRDLLILRNCHFQLWEVSRKYRKAQRVIWGHPQEAKRLRHGFDCLLVISFRRLSYATTKSSRPGPSWIGSRASITSLANQHPSGTKGQEKPGVRTSKRWRLRLADLCTRWLAQLPRPRGPGCFDAPQTRRALLSFGPVCDVHWWYGYSRQNLHELHHVSLLRRHEG